MTIYFSAIALIAYLSFIARLLAKDRGHLRKLLSGPSILVGFTLFLILALRGPSVGIDVPVYLQVWESADSFDLFQTSRFEPGFLSLTILAKNISDSPQIFLAILAFLSVVPISYVIRKGSVDPLLSWLTYICLGFYAFLFSGLRQAIAFGLTILALHFIREKKLVLFLCFTIIGATFHFSALIFLPAYWIYWVRAGKLGAIFYMLLIPFIYIFREPFFRTFTDTFYSNYEVHDSTAYTWLLFSALIISFCWYQFLYSAQSSIDPEVSKDTGGLLKIATAGLTLMLFASVGTNVMRMVDYYFVAIIFALPAVLSTIHPKLRLLIEVCFASVLIIVFFIQIVQSPYSIVPYRVF